MDREKCVEKFGACRRGHVLSDLGTFMYLTDLLLLIPAM